jgi:hypothetical protein
MMEDPVVKRSEGELRRGPQHDFLGEARQVHGADRGRRQRLEREVPVRHAVQGVRGRPVETQRGGGRVPVDREGRARQRGSAKGTFVEAPARIREAAPVARQHLDISEEVMAEGDGLGRLQMGEARHDGGGVLQRLLGEGALEIGDLRVEGVDRVADPQPKVRRDLVVARARRVQAPGRRAHDGGEP